MIKALPTIAIFLAVLAPLHAGRASAAPISFNRDIRPVLSETCFKCHGPDGGARKAGLRLDLREGALAPLEPGVAAIVPGDRAASTLYQRVTAADPDDRMPPAETGHTLSPAQIAALGQWIDEGAPYQLHWAFLPPVKAAPPDVAQSAPAKNAIDRFILARQEAAGLVPSPEANPSALLRRVYLDLTGLPPAPDALADFLADTAGDAYERVVDQLLGSPQFGERWGRHWLDAARYADSNGYSIDGPRSIWPYRDYVVNAFNANKPFDQFVIEQMAGDLLPGSTVEQRVATGFHRNTMINEEGGVDKEEFRMEAVIDRVNTVGTVFLGLTLGCARCHDHKYDPIAAKEYFQLFAFLNNDEEVDLRVSSAEAEAGIARAETAIAEAKAQIVAYLAESAPQQVAWEEALTLPRIRSFTEPEQQALLIADEKRTEEQRKLVLERFKQDDETIQRLEAKIRRHAPRLEGVPKSMVLAPRTTPRESWFLEAGDYTRKSERVFPGVPAVLHDLPPDATGTRLDLARWLVAPENPLLARVTVNRFWQQLFGRGLVETENDFGSQGLPPSHPELLDWLATEFVDRGWDTKSILKSIVMSATYRQSSARREDLEHNDPNNVLLARQNRLRLDAEIIRDAALSVAGVLDKRLGGPPVYPPQPEGVTKLGQQQRDWNASVGGDRYRRGLYTALWRATPYYGLSVFDAPNAQETCTRRIRSNTPLQALTLLNDRSFVELAQAVARRLSTMPDPSPEARLHQAFQWCLARTPDAHETALLLELYEAQRRAFAQDAPETVQSVWGAAAQASPENAAWTMVARALLNLDEFVTRE
ncbi:MAG: PSD1 domain-containing protein [Candidatus Hydrogenedentes bacterium]|nr:PSD1 domain-containing protein [Candidatus Hydrogenedentota bacterium]